MIGIKKYNNLREAVDGIQKKDREYIFVRHDFRAGTVVAPHFHPNVDEWAIFDNSGRFNVMVDFEKEHFDTHVCINVVYFPKGSIHGLKCFSDMNYHVLRGGADDIIYLRDILKRKSSVEPKEDPCGLVWELYNQKNISIAYVEVTGIADEHKHKIMEENYYVKKGSGELIINNKSLGIKKDDLIHIPKGSWHYLKKIKGKRLEVLVTTHPGYDPKDFIPKT